MESRSTYFTFLLQLISIITISLNTAFALDHKTSQHLVELRRQQLFPLAVGYCQSRLNDPLTSTALRSQLKVELAKTYAAQASSVRVTNHTELKAQSLSLLATENASSENIQEQLYFKCELAQLRMNFGEAGYWQSKLNHTDEFRLRVLNDLTVSCQQSLVLINDTKQWSAARQYAKENGKSALLNRAELLTLRKQLRLRTALALLRKKQLKVNDDTPEDHRAAAVLLSKLTSSNTEPHLLIAALLTKAKWEFFLKQDAEFIRTIQELKKLATFPQQFEDILALQIKFALHKKKPLQAAGLIQEGRKKQLTFSGELAYLTIHTLLELEQIARVKNDVELAEKLHNNVKKRLALISDEYWVQRSQRLYDSQSAANKYGQELQNVLAQAEHFQQSGNSDAAITKFKQAYALAQKGNFPELSAELSYRLGLLFFEEQQFEKAADIFQVLLNDFPQDNHTAQAHLMLVYCAAQLKNNEQVRKLLQEHRKNFPNSSTQLKATELLAHAEMQANNFLNALTLFRENVNTTGHSSATFQAMLNCYQKLILHKKLSTSQYFELYEMARHDFEAYLKTTSPNETKTEVEIRLVLTELNLLSAKPQPALLKEHFIPLTPAKVFHSPDLEPFQQRIIELYARVLTHRNEKLKSTETEFITSLSNQQKIMLYNTVVQQSVPATNSHLITLSQLESQIDVNDASLTTNEKKQLHIAFSLRLLNQKSYKTALSKINSVLETSQLSLSEIETLGTALEKTNETGCLQTALKIWKQAEQQVKPRSEQWFQSRYQQIRLHIVLKDSRSANKLYRLTTLLHQFPEGSSWEKKFSTLQDKLN